MKNKIGIGVITCNREHFFKQCIEKIPDVDTIIVVNDGNSYSVDSYPKKVKEVLQHSQNKCVGISKNEAMRYLIQDDCDHIFLCEDDVLIKNPEVCTQYIKTAEATGIWHLNYALQGPANRKQTQQGPMNIDQRAQLSQDSEPNPRQVVEYDGGIELALYPNSVGAFTYFYRGVIKAVGYHDEKFRNAWEHVEHTYRIIKLGLHPPFWWFADIAKSWEYIGDVPNCINESSIARTPEWHENFKNGMEWYRYKHGWIPQQTPDTSPQQVLDILGRIQKNYARKVL